MLGAGSFGTAVANLLAHNADVLLYVRRPAAAATMCQTRRAGGQRLAPNVVPTSDLGAVAAQCTVLFPIVPAAAFRALMQQLAPALTPDHVLIHGTKGLDVRWPPGAATGALPALTRGDVRTMSEVILAESQVHQVGCLAGPNLASELAQGQPAATVVASPLAAVLAQGQRLLRSGRLQVHSSPDLLGVELCGVFKNILAIGAGCLGGLGYGENMKGFLLSSGLAGMVCPGQVVGAGVRPFFGLAGVGDLVATCASSSSRNYTVGYRLAQGTPPGVLLEDTTVTAEGIATVRTVHSLVHHYQLQAPITAALYRVLFEGLAVPAAIRHLMQCPPRADAAFSAC